MSRRSRNRNSGINRKMERGRAHREEQHMLAKMGRRWKTVYVRTPDGSISKLPAALAGRDGQEHVAPNVRVKRHHIAHMLRDLTPTPIPSAKETD